MNFLIAVISESYSRVMEKLVAESFKVKVNMIVEKEQLFSQEERKSEKFFPQYLVVRKPVDLSAQDGNEWSGFIKDLKDIIKTNTKKSKLAII